jgi:S-adenosylmethionine:tRNA ribosyltransferase-isomerase
VPVPWQELAGYLAAHGRPVRYGYLTGDVTLDDLQTAYATHPGSAEMPSAGRGLTERVLARLLAAGVVVAPVVLHTGLSSAEAHEPPQPERFTVPEATARLVRGTRGAGRRVVAVGTTVVRALESAADAEGRVRPTAGWTGLVLGRSRPARVVDGLLTGLHDPQASHLDLLEAVAGPELVAAAYDAVTGRGPAYLWHELGDTMLLLP